MAKKSILDTGVLGTVYQDGQVIVSQGELGDCMYVIQEGQVEVVAHEGGDEVRLAVLGEREFFGEMAIFEREVRTATVRALGQSPHRRQKDLPPQNPQRPFAGLPHRANDVSADPGVGRRGDPVKKRWVDQFGCHGRDKAGQWLGSVLE